MPLYGPSTGGGSGEPVDITPSTDPGNILTVGTDDLLFVGDGVSLPTPENLMKRDASGRARVESPSNTKDIANKGYVDEFHTDKTASFTTASLTSSQAASGTVNLDGPGYAISIIQVDRACRLELYVSTTKRDADSSRAEGVAPAGDHGLTLEYIFPASGIYEMPGDIPGSISGGGLALPYRLTNKGTTGTVTVTMTYRRTK